MNCETCGLDMVWYDHTDCARRRMARVMAKWWTEHMEWEESVFLAIIQGSAIPKRYL